jgi:DNA-nicking Smr family endonuclease
LRSRNREPVLKRRVAGWLIQREEILAFCQARSADGGGGAVVVLLKGRE